MIFAMVPQLSHWTTDPCNAKSAVDPHLGHSTILFRFRRPMTISEIITNPPRAKKENHVSKDQHPPDLTAPTAEQWVRVENLDRPPQLERRGPRGDRPPTFPFQIFCIDNVLSHALTPKDCEHSY